MFHKFEGAIIRCDICGEEEEFKQTIGNNITEADMGFEQDLKHAGWQKVGSFDLCPKHAKEYNNADDTEEWLGDHGIL